MNNKFIKKILFLSIIAILFTSPLITGLKIKNSSINDSDIDKILEGGWFEERNGIKILHISGSYYEMGYQYGHYLKDSHMAHKRSWLNFAQSRGNSIDYLKEAWNITKEYIPEAYKEEIQGRADALGSNFIDEAIISIIIPCCSKQKKCFGFAAWGNATKDGKLYHAHSNDWELKTEILKDPITNTYAYQHRVLIVRNPSNAYSSVYIASTAGLDAEAGMNEKGICVSINTAFHFTNDSTIKGIPSSLRNLMVLDNAKNSKEAIDILTSNRTAGWNFILSDGNERKGYILEQTANYSYVGSWDNAIEDNYPSFKVKELVRRGNIFINYEAPGIDKEFYKKSSLMRLILNSLGLTEEKSVYFSILHFNVLSKELKKQHGTLDLNNSIKLLRKVYNGHTNFIFFLSQRVIKIFYSDTWDQKVFCPETGDIAISFAKNGVTAYRTQVHHFNIYKLLNSKPSQDIFCYNNHINSN